MPGPVGRADELEDDVERPRVDELVGRDRVHPEGGDLLAAVLVAHRGRHTRAGHGAELDGGRPDAARRAVDEQPLADDQAGLREQGVVGGEEDLGRAARRDPVQLVGHGHRDPLVDHRQLGLAAAGDDRHHAVAGLEALDPVAGLDHLARQLEPGDVLRGPGRGGIAAGELHHVGAVEAGGVHAHQQLAALRTRVRVLFDGDLTVANRRCSHRARCYPAAAKPPQSAVARRPVCGVIRVNGGPPPSIPTPYLPPLWRESRLGFEAAQLLRSPIWRGVGVAPGEGRPVLLIPGFMAGDGTLATMARWLRANGYWTQRAGIRANVGCSQDACERIEERLEALAARTGSKVAIVGQSRGGVLARVVATRRPDLVSGIVTLGAPTVGMLRVHPLVLLQVGLVGALGTGRVPGLFRMSCLARRVLRAVPHRPPARASRRTCATSACTRARDGIVDWRACLDGAADELVEIRASHCGMAVSVQAYEQVARALSAFAADEPAPLDLAAKG